MDRDFFVYWKDTGVTLSGEQKARLGEALSIWTRLYTLEFCGKALNCKGLIGTLENDVAELSAQIKRLKAKDETGLKVDWEAFDNKCAGGRADGLHGFHKTPLEAIGLERARQGVDSEIRLLQCFTRGCGKCFVFFHQYRAPETSYGANLTKPAKTK
jgi:hypothetical protein